MAKFSVNRRGFLGSIGGAMGAALARPFVVSNPTVLDNGLVVPESAVDSERIIAKREAKPITLATSLAVPKAAGFAGTLISYSVDIAWDSPAKVEMELYVWDSASADLRAASALLQDASDVDVYLVKRSKGG